MWQYGLLMQIPDWLGWRHLRINPNQKKTNSYGISAMILNYTQPLIILLTLIVISRFIKLSNITLWPAVVAFVVYIGTIVHNFMTRKIDFSLEPKNSKSISYNWWNIPQSIMYVLLSTLLIVTIPDKN